MRQLSHIQMPKRCKGKMTKVEMKSLTEWMNNFPYLLVGFQLRFRKCRQWDSESGKGIWTKYYSLSYSFKTRFLRDVNVAAKDVSTKFPSQRDNPNTSDELAACTLHEWKYMVVRINLCMRECRRSVNKVPDKVHTHSPSPPCLDEHCLILNLHSTLSKAVTGLEFPRHELSADISGHRQCQKRVRRGWVRMCTDWKMITARLFSWLWARQLDEWSVQLTRVHTLIAWVVWT
jgi:hypothetical protein